MQTRFDLLRSGNLNLACTTIGVPHFLTDQTDVRPKVLWLREEPGVWFQEALLRTRETKLSSEIPRAAQTSDNSIKSSRRSPDSYLLTNDCGRPRRAASSACVSPTSVRASRSACSNASLSMARGLLCTATLYEHCLKYPKLGYRLSAIIRALEVEVVYQDATDPV